MKHSNPLRSRWLAVITLSLLLHLTSLDLALANPANIPGSVDPGRIEQQFQKPPTPKATPSVTVPETPESVPPDKAESVKFVLSGIELEGASVYTQEELLPFWQQYLGKEISLLQIYRIADEITAYYRNAGYILTRAIVPPQKIDGGVVRIKVIEGYIDSIAIEGDVRWRGDLFRAWIEKIKTSHPLNNDVLERVTLLANELPGAQVTTVLKPAKSSPGASDLTIVIKQKQLEANAGLDNRGSRSSGPYQINAGIGVNSLFNLYEKTTFAYNTTDDFKELHYLGFSHEHMLTSEGTRFTFSGNRSWSHPGDYLSPFEIRGDNLTLGLNVSHPIIRSRQQNLSVFSGFTIRDSRTRVAGELQSDDRIRFVSAGVNYDLADPLDGVNMVNVEFHQGLDILNPSKTGSSTLTRASGHSDFTKLTLNLSRLQQLAYSVSLLVAASGQYAFNSLLSSEEFGYGGAQFGRAYDSSEITGDHGLSAKSELQYSCYPKIFKMRFLQFYGFYDFGATWNRSHTKADRQSGSSAGAGMRLSITDYINASLEGAQALTRPVAAYSTDGKGNDTRLFFTIAMRY